jgi:hypothetical protein
MMRRLAATTMVGAVAVATALMPATNANALGGETLGCRVAPGAPTAPYSEGCGNGGPSSSGYTIGFLVQNTSGTYAYAWSIPGYSSVYAGCTSTSNSCTIKVTSAPREYDMSVTLSQGGSSETLTAYADIEPWCGREPC